MILTAFHFGLLWMLCTFNSTINKQPGGNLAPCTVLSLCATWYYYVVGWIVGSLTTGVQSVSMFLIVHMSACVLCPGNESPWICAKVQKVTQKVSVPELLGWTHSDYTAYTDAVAAYETHNYNECHLKTALAFYTKICMAELHRDCMPFKKGQINIALLSHENTAVALFFLLSAKIHSLILNILRCIYIL